MPLLWGGGGVLVQVGGCHARIDADAVSRLMRGARRRASPRLSRSVCTMWSSVAQNPPRPSPLTLTTLGDNHSE